MMPKKDAEDARDLPETYHTYDIQHREYRVGTWATLDDDRYSELYDVDEAIMKCDHLNSLPTEGTYWHEDEYRVIRIEHTASIHYSPKPIPREERETNAKRPRGDPRD
jgi:hypothetical protein